MDNKNSLESESKNLETSETLFDNLTWLFYERRCCLFTKIS